MATDTFTSSGTWTCPAGVFVVDVECWGAGAGGAGHSGTQAGGGGGGAYAKSQSLIVVPGNNYTVTVGAGGAGGAVGVNGSNGADSWFNSTTIALAKGGTAGETGRAGGGGTAGACVGEISFAGGGGALNSGGGGGGGGAGTSAVGGNASGTTGGTGGASDGGAGGSSGAVGSTIGGGGGGGVASGSGGNGARGEVRITYTAQPLIAGYDRTNGAGGQRRLASGFHEALSQSFTGDGNTLSSVRFLVSGSSPSASNLNAKIYAHTGTFGTSSQPTGSALATSDTIVANTVTWTNYRILEFTFSGANQIELVDGTNYVVTIEGTVSSGIVALNTDTSSPTDDGNLAHYPYGGGSWTTESGQDLVFYVLGAAETAAGSPMPYYQMMRNG